MSTALVMLDSSDAHGQCSTAAPRCPVLVGRLAGHLPRDQRVQRVAEAAQPVPVLALQLEGRLLPLGIARFHGHAHDDLPGDRLRRNRVERLAQLVNGLLVVGDDDSVPD